MNGRNSPAFSNPCMRNLAVMVMTDDDELDTLRQFYRIVEQKRQIKLIVTIPKRKTEKEVKT